MENSYSVANIRGRGFMCRTNLPSNTAFRGFGGPQGMMVAESWITDVAQSLGRPAEEVEEPTRNKLNPGGLTFSQLLFPGAPPEPVCGRRVDALQPGPG